MRKRSLLTLIGAVVLLFGLSIPMMQCAPSGEEVTPPEEEITPPEEEVTPPGEGEIQYGGRLNIGFVRPLDSLTLTGSMMLTNWGCLVDMLIYDNLTHYNLPPDYFKFNPGLVQSYEVSEDGLTWTLHLVENARWHDGVPVTAEDVKFTCDYLLSTIGWHEPTMCWDHIDVIDDYTLKFVNTQVLATTNTPTWWTWDPIIPKHIFEPYKDDPESYANEEAIGCGPFKLKEFRPSEYMWLVANEDYWGGRPYVDEVVFRYYSSTDTMLMALRKGEIDVLGDVSVPPVALEDMRENPDIEVEQVPGISLYFLTFNLHKDTPLRDKNVRHAIAYGIDRDRIIDMVYLGYAEKYDGWVYEEDSMHNPNLPQYDYSLDKAKEILDGAGYVDSDGNGIRNDPATGEDLAFDLCCPSSEINMVKTCTLITEMLPDIGISVDFRTMDYDAWLAIVYNPPADGYEISLTWEEPGPAPYADWVWEEAMSWGAGGDWWNAAYYNNPHFDELSNSVGSAQSMEERRGCMYEMQEIMAEDLPYAFIARPKWLSAYRTDKFEGWVNEIGGPVSWLNPWSILRVHLK